MYQSDPNAVGDALSGSDSQALSDNPDVVDTIVDLTDGDDTVGIQQVDASNGGTVTVPAGTEILFVEISDTTQTDVNVPDAPVIVFEGDGGVDVVIDNGSDGDANSDADRVVVGSAGDDHIVVEDGEDSVIVTGSGDSTIVGGTGDDTIVAGLGNTTIDGGDGNNVVDLNGDASDYTIVVEAGGTASAGGGNPQAADTDHVIITNNATGKVTDVTNVQYVQLDGAEAMIFATSTVEAGVADLYHAAFGRTGEQAGIQYWFDLASQGYSLNQIAHGFTLSPEFDAIAAKTDEQFIFDLYANVFGRAADSAGVDYWVAQLAGGLSRADVLSGFATAAALNDAGVISTEATVVGTVLVVPHIV